MLLRTARVLVVVLAASAALAACAAASAEAGPLSFGAPVLVDHQPPFGIRSFLVTMTCPSSTTCVALDASGELLTSAEPAGGLAAWPNLLLPGAPWAAVSCPSTSFCVATDTKGDVLHSTAPLGGLGTWSATNIDGSTSIPSLYCPTTTLCAALDANDELLTSTNPAAGVWSTHRSIGVANPARLACNYEGACVIVDTAGDIFYSAEPANESVAWTKLSKIDAHPITAIGCAGEGLCAAGDSFGDVLLRLLVPRTGWWSRRVALRERRPGRRLGKRRVRGSVPPPIELS